MKALVATKKGDLENVLNANSSDGNNTYIYIGIGLVIVVIVSVVGYKKYSKKDDWCKEGRNRTQLDYSFFNKSIWKQDAPEN